MSFLFSANNTPANHVESLYNLKQLLLSAGWTVVSSGSGSSYSASSDVITSVSVLQAASAWFVVQMPNVSGVTRQLCFQRSAATGAANDPNWRIKYSYSAGFTGGTPSATRTPSATDEAIVLGSGTDASPTFNAWMTGTAGANRMHACAGNAAPYGFWAVAYPTGGGNPNWSMFLDPLAAGSYPSADVDPYVLYCGGGSSFSLSDFSNNNDTTSGVAGAPQCFFKKGMTGEAFRCVSAAQLTNSSFPLCAPGGSGGLGANPHTGREDVLPIVWSRYAQLATAPVGFKGYGGLAQWRTAVRSTADTYTLVSTSDRILLRDLLFPWNGTTPLV